MPPRHPSAAPFLVLALVAAALIPAHPVAARQDDPAPVDVMMTAASGGSGVRVVLAFSRPVEYRLDEGRSRLRLDLNERVSEVSKLDRDLGGEVVRRVYFDDTRRGTAIVFRFGRRFENFTLTEQMHPYRIIIDFHGEGMQAPDPLLPGTGNQAGVPDALPPDMTPVLPDGPGGAFPRPPSRPGEVRRVVLDAGHGGREDGAVGAGGLKEKDLALDLTRRLRNLLSSRGYEVTMTRERDQSLGLIDRTALANGALADLFVSLHANASRRASARGPEVYFLSRDAVDDDAMALARQENRSDAGATASSPSRDLEVVLWEMAQARHLSRSSRLAELIQENLNAVAGVDRRGVKQAPFRVLVGAAMPSVLVEVGFLSHADEEKALSSDAHRDRIAGAIAEAIDRFRDQVMREERALGSAAGVSP